MRASSANAVVSVAAKTRPPTTATPFGPSFGAVVMPRPPHAAGAPVERDDVDFHVCRYTVSPDDDGRRRQQPEVGARAADGGTASARRGAPTGSASIREAVAARVLARSPFG